ncbi:hypothetical protein Tco_0760909 [Tanacetum coccineum]
MTGKTNVLNAEEYQALKLWAFGVFSSDKMGEVIPWRELLYAYLNFQGKRVISPTKYYKDDSCWSADLSQTPQKTSSAYDASWKFLFLIIMYLLGNYYSKTWRPRRKRGQGSIRWLVYVHPNSGELFYLRMLLCHQKGCTTFEDIRTVNHKVYGTFRSACDALGLLGDDKEWDTALEEACFSSTTSELRSLFAHILIFCDVSDPLKLCVEN